MNIPSINTATPAFKSQYQLNVNQTMKNGEACLERDLMLGIWLNQTNNSEQLLNDINKFFLGEYKENKTAPCNVIYDIPDSEDAHFEDCMNKCGQKFDKLG